MVAKNRDTILPEENCMWSWKNNDYYNWLDIHLVQMHLISGH